MNVQATAGQSYSQSFVCRLERMDVTVRQAKEATHILRKWLEEADHKYCFLNAGGKLVPLCYSKNVAIHAKGHVKYVSYQIEKDTLNLKRKVMLMQCAPFHIFYFDIYDSLWFTLYMKRDRCDHNAHFRRQKRTVFPPEAIKRLNEYFEVDPSPNVYHTEQLAKELEVDAKTIQVWFCNRRQKWKQQQMQSQQQ